MPDFTLVVRPGCKFRELDLHPIVAAFERALRAQLADDNVGIYPGDEIRLTYTLKVTGPTEKPVHEEAEPPFVVTGRE